MIEFGGTIRDDNWEVERIAERYEMALRRGESAISIEQLLIRHALVAQEALLLALIEAELDVLGERADAKQLYLERFPDHAKSIQQLFKSPFVPSALPLAPGDRVGDYRVVRLIGRGAIGLVFLAEDSHKREQVAIKILRPDRGRVGGNDYRDLFRKEAVVTRSLEHPQIVKLLSSGEHGSLPYHVLEYIDGPTLADFSGRPTMDSVKAARIIADVADAIQYSHRRGVVHRDLKPSNILIDRQGRAHVTDFGIALEHSELGTGSSFIGTPLYMSPEQVRGSSHHLDGRSDVFSLGVILYQMTTGVHPFLPPNASQHTLTHSIATIPAPPLRQRADVPKEFDQICMKALAKDPMDRFNTAGDFAIALHRYVRRGSRKEQWALIACAALLLVGGLGFLWIRSAPRALSTNAAANVGDLGADSAFDGSADFPTAADFPTPVVSSADLAHMDRSITALLPNGIGQAAPQEVDLAAAMILARLKAHGNVPSTVWTHFGASSDNTLQTALIHLCAAARVDPHRLIEQAVVEQRPDVRIGLLLALSEYTEQQLPSSDRAVILEKLTQWYCYEPGGATHSVCGWLLRRWNEDTETLRLQKQLGFTAPSEQRQWFGVLPNIAMVACYPGHATVSADSETSAAQLPTDFAISTTEVTIAQWDWVMGDSRSMYLQPVSLPKTEISWHQCAAFCNRLTEVMGLADDEKCYEALPNHRYRGVDDAHLRRGFRMPTLTEWEFAARAGTTTDRHWGRSERYLANYANCRPHSLLKPVVGGLLKPNDLGLFDMLGNATEWIHNTPKSAESRSGDLAKRSIRGGSAWTLAAGVSASEDYTMEADLPSERMGLRLVQSLIEPSDNAAGLIAEGLEAEGLEAEGLRVELQTLNNRSTQADDLSVPTESLGLTVSASAELSTRQFLGSYQRGVSLPRTLVVTNRSPRPITLSAVMSSGCLRLLDDFAMPQRIGPGDSIHLKASVESSGGMLQPGQLTLHTLADDGTGEEFSCGLSGYFSGPMVAVLEGGLDSQGTIRLDFGKVRPGTSLQRLVTLSNAGNQLLTIGAPQTQGAIRLNGDPATHRLAHQASAFIEFEFKPLAEGQHVARLEFETNDPARPQVRVEAVVEAVRLPLAPVFGVYRQGLWLLDHDRDGRPDRRIEFGKAADQPFVADFDGDGVYELGVYRRVDEQHVELRMRSESAEGQISESTRSLQVPQGRLVVADFDGDGRSDVAWVSPGQDGLLRWQINHDGDGVWDRSDEHGSAEDVPVVGDWIGSGRGLPGAYRPHAATGVATHWLLSGQKDAQEPLSASFGLPGDQPVVGDWNGDGKTNIGVFRVIDGTGTFLLDHNLDPHSESFLRLGTDGDIAITFMAQPH